MKNTIVENIKINKLDKSRVEITGSIATDVFSKYRTNALEKINNEITIDGFRKGKIPENILISKVGESSVLEEMAEMALSQAYPEIIINNKIEAIGRPEISITKLAKDNPLEFKITTTVIPEVKLGDYKKIAKKQNEKPEEKIEITDKDIDEAMDRIRRARVDHSGHDHETLSQEEHEKLINSSLPEVNDEFARSIGDFKDLADLREKIKETLEAEKKTQSQDKRRIALSDAILEASSVEIPELLIESETRRIEAQFSDDISHMGIKIEDYLAHAKKTIDDLRKDWRPHAEKKAKLQLILNNIIRLEKIVVDVNEVENEVKHILAHYKDADQEQARVYAETVLTNEKAYRFLEEQ